MPRRSKELSALEVNRLAANGMHAIGGVSGLYMQIKQPSKSWILRAMVGGKRRDMGLGAFPTVTLAMARERARSARDAIDQGIDPILQRQRAQSALRAEQASALTFSEAVRGFIDAKSAEWRNGKHRQQWINSLATYAEPEIGKLLVADVNRKHVLAILEPIWKTKTETATRVRGRIEQVLDWAAARGHREGPNPAAWRGHLDKLLGAPSKIAKTAHHRALPIDAMPAFMADLRKHSGLGARALELVALTATRSGEVRGATWKEFDLEGGVWVIPAERMKAGREHRVPLSDAALALLSNQRQQAGCELVFPGTKGQQLSDSTLNAVLRRMGADCVTHGMRSTFRDWIGERTAYPHDVAEMALAHTIENKAEAAYRRGDMMDKRRHMMQAWADFCATPAVMASTVVPLTRSAA
jgi:integrase